jgi:hypothetical protein
MTAGVRVTIAIVTVVRGLRMIQAASSFVCLRMVGTAAQQGVQHKGNRGDECDNRSHFLCLTTPGNSSLCSQPGQYKYRHENDTTRLK